MNGDRSPARHTASTRNPAATPAPALPGQRDSGSRDKDRSRHRRKATDGLSSLVRQFGGPSRPVGHLAARAATRPSAANCSGHARIMVPSSLVALGYQIRQNMPPISQRTFPKEGFTLYY
jgi:hypothetical protein